MGLKNLEQQLSLVSNASKDANALRQYSISLNNILKAIDSSWIGGKDKYQLLIEIADCVNDATSLANRYYSFSLNTKKWLKEMDKLDKITAGFIAASLGSLTVHNIVPSNSSKLTINTQTLDDFATQIETLGRQLSDVKSGGRNIFGLLDPLIQNRLPYMYSATSLKNDLSSIKERNDKIVKSLRAICTLYERAENAILFQVNMGQTDLVDVGISTAVGITSANQWNEARKKTWEKTVKNISDNEKNSLEDKINSIIKKIKKTETGKKIIDDLSDTGYVGKIKDIEELLENIKDGKYTKIAEKIGDKVIGKLYDKKTGEFNTNALKAKALLITVKLTVKEDSYLVKNRDKYLNEDEAVKEILEGKYLRVYSRMPASIIQVLGKGAVDGCCKLVDSMIHATPAGKVLDYVNAVSKDVTGTSPEEIFNKVSNKISKGVDKIVDGYMDCAEEIDGIRNKVWSDLKKVIISKSASGSVSSAVRAGGGSSGGGGSSWGSSKNIGGTGYVGGGGGGTGGQSW